MLTRLIYLALLFYTCNTFAQFKKRSCDSLVNKPVSVLYHEAEDIIVAHLMPDRAYGNSMMDVDYCFKGEKEHFIFSQKNNPEYFNFQEDTLYLLFTFPEYEDPVFKPCMIFGKQSNMKEMIRYLNTKCSFTPVKRFVNGIEVTGSCERSASTPICGCDGNDYGSPCEASVRGIAQFRWGRCKDRRMY